MEVFHSGDVLFQLLDGEVGVLDLLLALLFCFLVLGWVVNQIILKATKQAIAVTVGQPTNLLIYLASTLRNRRLVFVG